MSKHTASAAGGAMPAEGHPDLARLLRIDEALDTTRNLIIAASNLAASDEAYPPGLHAVICAAEDKLDDARAALKESRGIAAAHLAAAPAADPVFEAIERHKTAWAAYVEATCKLTMPELDAYRETHDDDSGKALEAFLATPPTTLAGLRAALEYAVEVDSDCVPDNGGRIAETLLRSPLFAGMTPEGLADV